MYNCILVEDQWPVLKHLEKIIKQAAPNLQILARAQNLSDAIKAVEKHKPKIVFLDIQLANEKGFALLEHFRQPFFETIVVTGYDFYAIEALRWCAADYLLKPVTSTQLNEALARVTKRLESGTNHRKTIADNLLAYWQWQMLTDYKQMVLPLSGEQFVVTLSEILWLESKGSYTKFNFSTGTSLLIGKGLYEYAHELEPFGFINRLVN
jgi:two-component system LytT family response regulator